jgi:hypothetical protein
MLRNHIDNKKIAFTLASSCLIKFQLYLNVFIRDFIFFLFISIASIVSQSTSISNLACYLQALLVGCLQEVPFTTCFFCIVIVNSFVSCVTCSI